MIGFARIGDLLKDFRLLFVAPPDISSVEEVETFSLVDFRPCFFIFLLPTLLLFGVVDIEAVSDLIAGAIKLLSLPDRSL